MGKETINHGDNSERTPQSYETTDANEGSGNYSVPYSITVVIYRK